MIQQQIINEITTKIKKSSHYKGRRLKTIQVFGNLELLIRHQYIIKDYWLEISYPAIHWEYGLGITGCNANQIAIKYGFSSNDFISNKFKSRIVTEVLYFELSNPNCLNNVVDATLAQLAERHFRKV